MNSLRALKLALLLLLILSTLGWKLSARPVALNEAKDRAVQLEVADFLRRQRLSVTVSERFEEGEPAIRANGGACRILVTKSPALGWDRDLVRRLASATDDVFVVYKGRVYAEQPTFLTVSDFLWARLRRELGISSQSPPVLAVVAAKDCDARQMPWADVT